MPLKIFYLDDEEQLLEVFAALFASPDVEITICSQPTQALEMIRLNPPDLLLIDYRLPGMMGEQVAALVDPRIAKVLVTGEINVSPSARFRTYFAKPYDTTAIRGFIDEEVLKRKP